MYFSYKIKLKQMLDVRCVLTDEVITSDVTLNTSFLDKHIQKKKGWTRSDI